MLPRTYRLPLLILILEIIGFVYLFRLDSQKNNDDFYNYYAKVPVIEVVVDKKNEIINNKIVLYTGKIPGDYAVYIKDLKSGREFKYNESKIFVAASIYKMAILNEVYSQINSGKLNKNDKLTANRTVLDKRLTGAEDLESEEDVQIGYTVEYATSLMIRISDNYSALMLADRVGWKNAEQSLRNMGIDSFDLTSINAPAADANSVGKLLEKMYLGKAVSASASAEMLVLLKDQQINDRIPKLLPKAVEVAHKTGELDKIRHDAGIVYGDKSDYIIVLLTETNKPLDAIVNMAAFSKDIYEILEK